MAVGQESEEGYSVVRKMEEEKNEIRKQFIFNGKDFNNWKFRVEILLREHDVENFIGKSLEEHNEIQIHNEDDQASRTAKEKLKVELKKKERKCFSLIVQRIGNDYLEYVKDKNNPKDAWSSLCAAFERKGVSNRMFLRRKLLSLKMKENDNLEHHLLEFDKILRSLKAVGANMEEEDIICQLLLSLPESYESVITALETMKAEELTIEFVKGRLLDIDIKKKSMGSKERLEHNEDHPSAMMGYNKKQITCFLCGKKGHFQNNCPDYVRGCTCSASRNARANLVKQEESDSSLSSF